MLTTIRRAVTSWRTRAELSAGPTYEATRAEMGGAPWREVPKSTDAWYILDDEAAELGAPAEPRRMRVAVLGTGVAAVVTALLFLAVGRSHAHGTALPAASIAAATSVSPGASAPATASGAPSANAPASAPSAGAPAAAPSATAPTAATRALPAPVAAAAPASGPAGAAAPARVLASRPHHHTHASAAHKPSARR